jgi:hypothetical protein
LQETGDLSRNGCLLHGLYSLLLLDGYTFIQVSAKKEAPFEWSKDQQKAFELIKLALISAPVWGRPEAGQTYRLDMDASDYTIAGAVTVALVKIRTHSSSFSSFFNFWLTAIYVNKLFSFV